MASEDEAVAGERRQTQDVAPELLNLEQDDEQEQAQTLADEALSGSSDAFGLEDTEKVSTGAEGDDVQDLVDHMRQMVSSGLIDNSAYAGEPNDDDNDGMFLPDVPTDHPDGTASDGA